MKTEACQIAVIALFLIIWVGGSLIPQIYEDQRKQYSFEIVEVAKVIAAEACGEGKFGMELVANVIRNRAVKWDMTPLQVVAQKNQFYGYTAKNKETLYEQCKNVATKLSQRLSAIPSEYDREVPLCNEKGLIFTSCLTVEAWEGDRWKNKNIVDMIQGAIYIRKKSEPIWSWHGEETFRYKNHIFHKEAK